MGEPTEGLPGMSEMTPQRIEARARYALAQSPILALRELRVESEADTLLISGRVDSYYHKQLAQEVIRKVKGIEMITSMNVSWDAHPSPGLCSTAGGEGLSATFSCQPLRQPFKLPQR